MGGFSHDDFTPFQPPPPNAPPQHGPPPAVVISTRLWKQLYNSDPAVVGKPIHFAEFNSTVSGVAPRDFDIPHGADIWIAQRTPATDVNHGQEGVHAPAARRDDRAREGRDGDGHGRPRQRLSRVGPATASTSRGRWSTRSSATSGRSSIIVMSATGLLLLLACVNVANLLLARGAARAREMAVRAALGAGWSRLVRQLLTESMVLAAAGTIVGVAVGALGLRALLAIGASKLPRLDAVPFDARVLLFSLVDARRHRGDHRTRARRSPACAAT